MKGIICAEVERFEWTESLPEPVLEAGHAIVSIKRIGICGTDLHAFKGNQPFFSYPRILGHELAGIIEGIGYNEQGLTVGDQVSIIPYVHCGVCIACRSGKTNCCTDMSVLGVHRDGGMRERISVPVACLLSANGLTLDQTAVLEPLAIGAHAVRRSGLAAGETALVIGGGPIGLGVMAIAKHIGAKVIAMDISGDRLSFCEQWAGTDALVNALQDEPVQRIMDACGGELPTVVFDATGNARSMGDSFRYVAHGGRLVFVGLVKADITFNDPEFHKRELTLMASRNATREDFDTVLEALSAGSIDVNRYITHRAPLAEMIEQFQGWLKPESRVIKAMVEL
ncbi:zinc-binding alcohol dehydrogenase family protein [Paenibacillus sp. CF384]|uniref:zinc-binding alcohol dehydrogenase family protein n=1 Tax=Paenibacillus sp. CF384 TaxID=1884382 RepID=UPI000896571E|nr:zinc-binding alcohol dehydrogenase family protein [Paenibacillus sp. CF384]SDX98292.1 2-desacetyl-2-hydroxyethyl bacteriochlorophyllide A dehydrogenase [Paenibacillus sp. CF384]